MNRWHLAYAGGLGFATGVLFSALVVTPDPQQKPTPTLVPVIGAPADPAALPAHVRGAASAMEWDLEQRWLKDYELERRWKQNLYREGYTVRQTPEKLR